MKTKHVAKRIDSDTVEYRGVTIRRRLTHPVGYFGRYVVHLHGTRWTDSLANAKHMVDQHRDKQP
jgi:hypothetical protein